MEIREQRIAQIILVRFDEIPIDRLVHRTNIEKVNNEFQFSATRVGETADGNRIIIFENGIYPSNEEAKIIPRLVIEGRKTQLYVEGTSDDARQIYDKLRGLIARIKGVDKEGYLVPIIETYESTMIVDLNFPFEALISKPLWEFAKNDLVKEAKTDLVKTSTSLSNLEFEINYLPTDNQLAEHRITLARKKFVIAPRPGYPPEERVYVSEAPLTSGKHLELLKKLEHTLSSD